MRGSIRQRGATWTAYWFTIDASSGKRLQHSKGGFRRKKDAEEHLNEVMTSVANGSYRRESKTTVGELLDNWLAAQEIRGLRPNTVVMYRNAANGWLRPHVSHLKVSELNAASAGDLVRVLRSPAGGTHGRGGLSDRSIQIAIGVLKAACRWEFESGRLMRDPLAGFRRPKARDSERASSAWSPDECAKFLAAVNDDRLRALWWLLLTRGLRRGEALGVRWSDTELGESDGALRIVVTRVAVPKLGIIESMPKTSAGRRSIPLDAVLCAELRAHRKRQLEDRMRAGSAWTDSGLIFVDEVGGGLLPDTVSRTFTKLATDAGVRRIRLHDGRHSAASILLASGTPAVVVAELLGHASPVITSAIYAHALPNASAEAAGRLSELLVQKTSEAETAAAGVDNALTSSTDDRKPDSQGISYLQLGVC